MKHSDTITLHINDKQHISDSISLILTCFSHKHPIEGGPTKASASVTVSDGKSTADMLLSVYGKDGKTEIEYEQPVVWKNHRFELIGFDYDTSIQVIVSSID